VPNYICRTCGVQYAENDRPPERCLICEDERQYVPPGGQQWTTMADLEREGHANRIRTADPGVESIHTTPRFAIGQRACLVRTSDGNFLWDCISYLDDATVTDVQEMGGVQGISVSHPHFYASVVEWSRAFGGAPIYLPEADREYVVRPDAAVQWYRGKLEVWPGLTLVQVGGHFDGSAVLHWADGAEGRGALFTGDSVSVAQDSRWVTFMRSYPNYIPLPPEAVRGVVRALEPYSFDRIYGGWWDSVVLEDGKASVSRSADRYIRWTGQKG
jgi:glyoxylase-like metal-dependent hydrolase (beta-lactamase superfamily II)